MEHFIKCAPPATVDTAGSTLIQALLHLISHLPPSLRLFIFSHSLHIRIEISAGILERGEQDAGLFVVEDGVIVDVAPCNPFQDARPDLGMDFDVFIDILSAQTNGLADALNRH